MHLLAAAVAVLAHVSAPVRWATVPPGRWRARMAASGDAGRLPEKRELRFALRADRKAVRDLARAMGELQIPGAAAVDYAECLVQQGVREVRELGTLSDAVLDGCSVRRMHKQKLKTAGALLLGADVLARPADISQTVPPPDAASGLDGDDDADEEEGTRRVEVVVSEEFDGARVDAALAALLPPLSRTYFGALCADGLVTCDRRALKKSARVAAASQLAVRLRAAGSELGVAAEALPLDVIYEDDHMLAVNKASGMVVHPAPGHWNGTFVNALLHHLQTESAPATDGAPLLPDAGDGLRPGIVHRLDRYTSGALLAAKSAAAHRALLAAFAERRVWKLYIVVCAGGLAQERTRVDAPIGRHRVDRLRMDVCEEGRAATSIVHRLATDGRHTLAAVLIRTGRTHQIRVHMRHIGAPVLGDPLYGDANANRHAARRASRPLLHAVQVRTSVRT